MKQLKKLKAGYIKVYLGLYARARLNLTQDKEKKELLQDYRLKHLRRLATVNSINSVQLTEFDNQIGKLRTGTVLTEKDLENDPKSPDGFWPSMEDTSMSCEARLASLKTELEKIHKSWTKSLLNDLADPVIQSHFELLKAPQKKMLRDFMAAKELPDEISQEFLTAIQQALSAGRVARAPRRPEKSIVPRRQPSDATPAEFKNASRPTSNRFSKAATPPRCAS